MKRNDVWDNTFCSAYGAAFARMVLDYQSRGLGYPIDTELDGMAEDAGTIAKAAAERAWKEIGIPPQDSGLPEPA